MAADWRIGPGRIAGKAVYATRDFRPGEVVIKYNWRELSSRQWLDLPASERQFVHSFWGRIQLFGIPERYVNHSDRPNTEQDLGAPADRAVRPIRSGKEITTDANLELKNEVRSLLELVAGRLEPDIDWLDLGRNAASCRLAGGDCQPVVIELERHQGCWRIMPGESGQQPEDIARR